jgi:hypothetical protein
MSSGMTRWMIALALGSSFACGGQTEGESVLMTVAVEPRPGDDAAALGEFTTRSGWHVRLAEAQLGVAALYAYTPQRGNEPSAVAQLLDLLVPVARAHGAFDPLNGRPVRAEYRQRVALDLLAEGVHELGEVSAEAGVIDELSIELLGPGDDLPQALQGHSAWVAGEAERGGVSVRFEGGLDLQDKGGIRRVESIETEALIEDGATLVVRVDPGRWLVEADFSRLAAPAGEDEPSAITAEDQVGRAWYLGARNPSAFSVEIVGGEQR